MQAKKDTLFSINNEELKKERKYALLTMKILFVYFCLASIGIPLYLAWDIFFHQPFTAGLFFYFFIRFYAPVVTGYLGVTLLIINALRKLHFWVCYIAGGFSILFFLYDYLFGSSQITTTNLIVSFYLILSLVAGILLLIAPYRVQTFLKSQKKSFLPESKAEILEEIKSSNDPSDKKRRGIKKNTLFSIQDDSLREEREYSLWIMRVYFIFFCLISINIFYLSISSLTYTYQRSLFDNLTPILCLVILPILLIFVVYGLWTLKFWCYFLVNGLVILFLIGIILLSLVPNIAITYVLLIGISFLLPTWRVRSFLKEQNKKLTAQEMQNTADTSLIEQSPESFIEK